MSRFSCHLLISSNAFPVNMFPISLFGLLIFGFLCVGLLPTKSLAEVHHFYVGEIYPLIYVDSEGQSRGSAVDVVNEIMKAVGKPLNDDSLSHIAWARAIDDVETTKGLGIFCLARTPQREGRFKWVGPIAHLNLGLVAKRSSKIRITSDADLRKYKIGVVRDSAPVSILNERCGMTKKDMTLLVTDEQQFKMLALGRVDLITQSDLAVPHTLRRLDMAVEDFEMVYVLNSMDLYIAFNRETSDEFISNLQAALDNLKVTKGNRKSRFDTLMLGSDGMSGIQMP